MPGKVVKIGRFVSTLMLDVLGIIIIGAIAPRACPHSPDEYIPWTCHELSSEYKKREKLLEQNQKKYLGKDNQRYHKEIEEINFRYQHVQDYPENCRKFIQQEAKQKQ